MQEEEAKMQIGDKVEKISGYRFIGTVVSVFKKVTGEERLIVENSDGLLHIFKEENLRLWK